MMKRFFAFLIAALMIAGCNNKPQVSPGADYMICGDVVYGGKFKQSYELEPPQRIELDVIGGLDFVIRDSLLIFSTSNGSGYWSFYSLPRYDYLGKFLRQGRGPNEFEYPVWFGDGQLYNSKGELLANVYDFGGGKYYEINITKTLADSTLTTRAILESAPTELYNSVVIDDNTLLYRDLQDASKRMDRHLLKNGEVSTISVLDRMNLATVKSSEYTNLLYGHPVYLRSSGRIVEAPFKLNYLNIYTLDGSFTKTICTDGELFNLSEMQNVKMESLANTYIYIREYGDKFAVLRERFAVQFFDMDGNPLVEFLTDYPCTSFDFDFERNHLYSHNYETEEFVRYDVSGMLDFAKK